MLPVRWYDNAHTQLLIINHEFARPEDVFDAIERASEEISAQPHPVDVIWHQRDVRVHPSNHMALARRCAELASPNLRNSVVVVRNPSLTRGIILVARKVLGPAYRWVPDKNVFFAGTVEEAQALLASKVATV